MPNVLRYGEVARARAHSVEMPPGSSRVAERPSLRNVYPPPAYVEPVGAGRRPSATVRPGSVRVAESPRTRAVMPSPPRQLNTTATCSPAMVSASSPAEVTVRRVAVSRRASIRIAVAAESTHRRISVICRAAASESAAGPGACSLERDPRQEGSDRLRAMSTVVTERAGVRCIKSRWLWAELRSLDA